MERIGLAAKTREETGKQSTKQLRRVGNVPANLYGHGMKPLAIQVVERDLYKALQTKAGENVVINMQVEGVQLKESTCLIKEIQHNPVTDKIAHVDFTVVSATEKIAVKVPFVVLNVEESAGVKEGGVLDIIHHEIDVECILADIPEKIQVSVKDLKIGDAISAKDLVMPKGVTCMLDPNEVVAAIHAAREEEAAPSAEAAGLEEPEVIEKGKKPEAEEETKKE